jgi:hypothetical protein
LKPILLAGILKNTNWKTGSTGLSLIQYEKSFVFRINPEATAVKKKLSIFKKLSRFKKTNYMRKQILPSLLFISIMVFFVSCKKESVKPAPAVVSSSETVNVKISPNQPYQMDLADASNLTILKQASHFSISEALAKGENGVPVYKYAPVADFAGTDEVTLLSSKTDASYFSGAACHLGHDNKAATITQYITLKITIAN